MSGDHRTNSELIMIMQNGTKMRISISPVRRSASTDMVSRLRASPFQAMMEAFSNPSRCSCHWVARGVAVTEVTASSP